MAMQESRGKIAGGFRDLQHLWASTQVHWNDARSHEFEEKVFKPLEHDLRTATGAMDQMAALLTQLRRECE
jgi:hypothetical protein